MAQLIFIPEQEAEGGDADTGSSATTTTTHLYISSAGNDSNTGLSSGSPVLTIAKMFEIAYALCPILGAPLVFNFLEAGSYVWSEMPGFTQVGANARIVFTAPDSTRTLVATLTTASGTDATKIVVAGPLTVDVYQHAHMTVTTGPAAGYRRTVMSNTATDVIPLCRFETTGDTFGYATGANVAVTPGIGDTVLIHNPGVVITGVSTATDVIFNGIGKGDNYAPLILHNLRFNDMGFVGFNACTLYCYGVQIGGTDMPIFSYCRGSLGIWDHRGRSYGGALPITAASWIEKASWLADLALATDSEALGRLRGWGVSCPSVISVGTAAGFMVFSFCSMSGLVVTAGLQANQSYLRLGGMFWSGVTINPASEWNPIGRGSYNENIAGSVVVKGTITNSGKLLCWVPLEVISTGYALLAFQAVTTIARDSVFTGHSIIRGGSATFVQPNTMTNNSAIATLTIELGAVVDAQSLTITNTGAGRVVHVKGHAAFVGYQGGTLAVTCVGTGGVLADSGTINFATVPLVITSGPVILNNSTFLMGANLTMTSQVVDAIQVLAGSVLNQTAGITTVTPTTGRAMRVINGGRATLRGAANTVLTGSAGNPGLHVESGGAAWFGAALSSVTESGVGTGDIRINADTAVVNTTISAAFTALTDGAGTTIARSA